MRAKNNIIDQLRKELALMSSRNQRGLILQPGAIGDCILTLPLAEFMKETVCKGGLDVIGHTEYIGILPGRSRVDAVRSMDSMDLHRLFAKEREFELADGDPLITAFADYAWIATFLGEPNSDFELNLIFTAYCSHSAEVMTLAMKPGDGDIKHISEFYKEQFAEQSGLYHDELVESAAEEHKKVVGMPMIRPTPADMNRGKEILAELGVMPTRKPVIIHPGSGGRQKCWQLDNFLSVAKMLASESAEVVFLLGPAEIERFSTSAIAKIEDVGRALMNLSLADALAALSCAAGYAGNDSGITHLAAALGIRTVAVFGPTDPAVYGPLGPAVTILHSDASDFAEAVSENLQQQICKTLIG